MTHEKGGYRVQLDRGDDHFWVPDSYVRDHENDFRIGAALTFDGIFRGGLIYVDAVGWPEAGRYGDRHDRQETTVRGMVDRVDTRRNIVVIRDERTRRRITIDASRMEQPRGPLGPFMGQMGGIRVRDLHRGDYVELSGYWDEETFVARHVDRVRNDRR